MIDGVNVKVLKKIPDDRGTIMKMMEVCDPEFKGFGEIYFSKIYPGFVKGWHLHEEAILNYAVITGIIRLVLYDDRENSKTRGVLQEIYMGDDNYCLVQMPPRIWNGFQCIGPKEAIVADLITIEHSKDVMKRMDPHNNDIIKFNWEMKDR